MTENNTLLSIVLWCFAQIFYVININVEVFYDWSFKLLSLISLALIIAVNFKKLQSMLRRKKF